MDADLIQPDYEFRVIYFTLLYPAEGLSCYVILMLVKFGSIFVCRCLFFLFLCWLSFMIITHCCLLFARLSVKLKWTSERLHIWNTFLVKPFHTNKIVTAAFMFCFVSALLLIYFNLPCANYQSFLFGAVADTGGFNNSVAEQQVDGDSLVFVLSYELLAHVINFWCVFILFILIFCLKYNIS